MKFYCDALPLSPMALNDIEMTKQGTLSFWQKSRVTWILQAGFHWDGEKGVDNLTWPHPDSTAFWVFPSDEQIWNEAQNWDVYSQFCHLPTTPQNSQLPNSGLNLALLHFLQKIKCVPETNNKRAHSALAQCLLPHLSLSPPLFTLSFKLGFPPGPKPSVNRNCSSHLHGPHCATGLNILTVMAYSLWTLAAIRIHW